jgi:connector enhancer of kinase suppressor of Ras 2
MYQYTHSFTNNGVSGKQLLNIRPYELEQLGIKLIGHQEIILEAVDYLKNFVSVHKHDVMFSAT